MPRGTSALSGIVTAVRGKPLTVMRARRPGRNLPVVVGERRLDLDGAAIDVDRRDRWHRSALEARAGQRVGDDLDLLADAELREIDIRAR